MYSLKTVGTILLNISLFAFGLGCASADAQESELELIITSAQNSLPLSQYSENRDSVMKINCDGLNWTLGWSEKSKQLTGKVTLKNGLKYYDVTAVEDAIFQNFSMINTPIVNCSNRDKSGVPHPTQIFVSGTDASSSNSKSIKIYFDELAETPVIIETLKVNNVLDYVDQKIAQHDELFYEVALTCGGYKWNFEWEKTALESAGKVRAEYKDQHVKYDPVGRSVFDKFSQLGTPSLLCSTPRNSNGLAEGSVSSQLRLGGMAEIKGQRARAIISAYVDQGLLTLKAEDLTK